MTRFPTCCQLFDLDGAPAMCADVAEPSHIHIVRPSRRAILPQSELSPFAGDAIVEDDSAVA
ncbi:MAG: hypothetical protein JOZ81_06350 [Chloroflexi bacterium]|nr:hypothetical protein [Chloroflexota bacterium]